ncbi:MAG: hypothetical protein LBT65_05905 [Synergistaceae bacterium]|jgi:xylulokinase|nr:hypothetical protein [Synergistaceae bacterium]
MRQLLGVDVGTGGCKSTLIDAEGRILATAFQEISSCHLHPGWSEQNPEDWVDGFVATVKKCLAQSEADAAKIEALCFTASTHNAVLLDENFQVIRPCIMWNDQRSADIARRLDRDHGETIFSVAMQRPSATWTMPQLQWIRENEPEHYNRIRHILFTKDYVRHAVTGDMCTDHVDAQGSLLYDALNRRWSTELCSIIGLGLSVLPEIKTSKEVVGCVSREVAARTGLRPGTPAIAGCSDTAAEDYGSGAVEEGQTLVKLATAGNVNIIQRHPRPHPKTYTYPYSVDGMWYTVTGTSSSAAAYRWLRDALYPGEKAACEARGEDVYLWMDKEAERTPAGARGLLFHPYLLGERCPHFSASYRANFFGVSMVHDRGAFSRAVLEGVAFSLYDCFQVIKEFWHGQTPEIRLIGGGAKSLLWCRIIADVFGLPVLRPLIDDSSFGGALLAGVGTGVFRDEISAVSMCNHIQSTCVPNSGNHEIYLKLFDIYKKIAAANASIWDELAGVVKE